MSGIERTQVLRIDCTTCKGRGYTTATDGERICATCEGRGVLERDVPYKFETQGVWTPEEKAEAFEIPVEQVEDKGHSTGD